MGRIIIGDFHPAKKVWIEAIVVRVATDDTGASIGIYVDDPELMAELAMTVGLQTLGDFLASQIDERVAAARRAIAPSN